MHEYLKIDTEAGMAMVRHASKASIAAIDGIIFDVDGVLIDVRESIQLVHRVSADMYFRSLGWRNCEDLVLPADVDAFKLAGGFNSDWHLAYAWQLLYLFKSARYESTDGSVLRTADPVIGDFASGLAVLGGGLDSAVNAVRGMCSPGDWVMLESRWDRAGLQRLFVEVYSGDLCPEVYGFPPETVKGPGLIREDRPILDPRFIPACVRLGIATGRTAGETRVGLRLMGWGDLFDSGGVVTEDDGFRKPDPGILELAVKRLGAGRTIYIGDTADDLLTVNRYNEIHGDMLACCALSGHFRGETAAAFFAERDADLIADNVNAALAAIDLCMGGGLCPAEMRT